MEEEELGKAGLKADFPNVKPEELHDGGQCAESETQVSEGQHGEEEVHGLAERGLCANHSENGGVAHNGDGIEAKEGDGDPEMESLKSRDAREDEVEGTVSDVSHF